MADYLETPAGRTTLKVYANTNNPSSANAYNIHQFDKATNATKKKTFKKNLKQHSDLNIQIEREAQISN